VRVDKLELTAGEIELLDAGRHDDIALDWVLIHLGLVDTPGMPIRPSTGQLDQAFVALARLADLGLVRVGHIEYMDRGPAGRVAPVELVPVPLDELRTQVDAAVASAVQHTDWGLSCWSVNTDAGDARAAAESPEQ
jgi:hypothetical protein